MLCIVIELWCKKRAANFNAATIYFSFTILISICEPMIHCVLMSVVVVCVALCLWEIIHL